MTQWQAPEESFGNSAIPFCQKIVGPDGVTVDIG